MDEKKMKSPPGHSSEEEQIREATTENDLPLTLDNVDDEKAVLSAEASLMEEIAILKDQLLRALAEADNIRKRATREQDETRKYAITHFSRDLLSVSDNLSRALESIPAEDLAESPLLETVVNGVAMTQKELLGILERQGIQKISAMGEKFNPHLHQAMMEVEGPAEMVGKVIQVLQEGYQIHDRLLRPVMVTVGKTQK